MINKLSSKRSDGFTLIELLVVVVIIGLLVSVMVIGIIRYREKAQDVGIEGALSQVRRVAVMVYGAEEPNSYESLCDPSAAGNNKNTLNEEHFSLGDVLRIIEDDVEILSGKKPRCYASSTKYCVQSTLISGGKYCVDSSGIAVKIPGTQCKKTNIGCTPQ